MESLGATPKRFLRHRESRWALSEEIVDFQLVHSIERIRALITSDVCKDGEEKTTWSLPSSVGWPYDGGEEPQQA